MRVCPLVEEAVAARLDKGVKTGVPALVTVLELSNSVGFNREGDVNASGPLQEGVVEGSDFRVGVEQLLGRHSEEERRWECGRGRGGGRRGENDCKSGSSLSTSTCLSQLA
jgi:hypothetical protein